MHQASPMRTLISLLFFSLSATCPGQNADLKKLFREHYAPQIKPGNTFVDAGPNYTVERSPDGHYLKKTYYFETGLLTTAIQYADSLLRKKDGIAIEWYDDGRQWSQGQYKNDLKTGHWKEEGNEYGLEMAFGEYVDGKKEGLWAAFDSLNNKCEARYKEGKLVGQPQYFNPDGSENQERLKRFIKKMGGDADLIDNPPAFPCHKKYRDTGKECGMKSLMDYLYRALEYPEKAQELGIEGSAIIEFVVEKDGSVVEVVALRGICNDIKKECLRIVKKMPKWNPGIIDDQPVRVRYRLPVHFKLD
jgi:TonB family protein